jgi:polyisoprenoid-binding protein YceI
MTVTTTNAAPTLTREYQGNLVPAPGTYEIDVAHTTVEFVARHLMISKVRGRFGQFSGTITVGDVPEESSVEVTIDAASLDTAQEQRDEHLRSADFFDVAQYPTLSFRSTSVAPEGDDRWKVTGDLTVRDVTRPVVLDVEFHGGSNTPWGTAAIGFSASTEVDRDAWGLTWNQALETGGVLVGKKVRIEISVEANPKS